MTQLDITKESPSFWRVSFNNPPLNLFDAQTIIEARALLDAAENDPELTVIVFESANPDYFIAHWDLTEDLAGADDFDGALAERYGYVNRAVPDAELDEFVTAFASRVARADRATLAEMKSWVDAITLPAESEFPPQAAAFAARLATPRVQGWAGEAFAAGLQQPGDLEERLGSRSFEF